MKRPVALGMGVVLVGLVLALVAFGADPKGDPAAAAPTKQGREARRLMKSMDADGDGKISLAEYRAWRLREAHRQFAAEDANGDGKISVDEYIATGIGRQRARFYWLDTANSGFKSDGVIDRAEAEEADFRHTAFAKRDTNGDGKIEWAEWHRAWLAEVRLVFSRHGVNADGGIDFAEAHPKIEKDIATDFTRHDTDGDGFVSEAEFVEAAVRIARLQATRLFNEIDEE